MQIFVLNLLVIAVLLNETFNSSSAQIECVSIYTEHVLNCSCVYNDTMTWTSLKHPDITALTMVKDAYTKKFQLRNESEESCLNLVILNMTETTEDTYICSSTDNTHLSNQHFEVYLENNTLCQNIQHEDSSSYFSGIDTQNTSTVEPSADHFRVDTVQLYLIICSEVVLVMVIMVRLVSCWTAGRCRGSKRVQIRRSTIQESGDVTVELQDVMNTDEDEIHYSEID